MPRGQDVPIQSGGQIDPYVASSMQQNKQLANNRLITAMQEAGATSRANASNRTAIAQQQMQIRNQQNMQAAELEAQDRRAAETERARRDDQNFTRTMQETSQTFQAEQSRLDKEYQDAVRNKEWDRADKIYEQMEAARRFDYELEMDSSERTTNAILSMTKTGMQQQSAKEKAFTTLSEQEEQFDRDKDIYNTTIERTIEGFNSDKRMDLPIADVKREELKARVPSTGGMISNIFTHVVPAYAAYKHVKNLQSLKKEVETIKETGFADPLGVLQSQMNQTGSPISAEELHPERIGNLEKAIVENKIQAQDIRNTAAVLEGTIQVFNDRISKASTDVEIAFWKTKMADVIQMRNALESLKNSTQKISGNENESVGIRIRTALGIKGNSLGGRVKILKESMGTTDYDQLLSEMTKPLKVPALKEVTVKMTSYERQLREQYNAMLLRRYPELGEK